MVNSLFFDSLKESLTHSVCEDLDVKGFAILSNALPDALIKEIRIQVKKCFQSIPGAKTPNVVHLLSGKSPVQLTKPHIFECDLYNKNIRDQLPFFKSLFDHQLGELVDLLRERVCSLEDLKPFSCASEAANALTLKLQMNEGGAFPWHYDNPGKPNNRKLTMAVYLTENWCDGMGGEIQLLPFLEAPVTAPPDDHTVVFFRSDLILHRTIPFNPVSGSARYCFTVWFDGFMTNGPLDLSLRANQLREEEILYFKKSPIQRIISRAVYDEEFRESIEDCFGKGSVECELALTEHKSRINQLLSSPLLNQFLGILHTYKPHRLLT